jgi:hypothetical protein
MAAIPAESVGAGGISVVVVLSAEGASLLPSCFLSLPPQATKKKVAAKNAISLCFIKINLGR